MSNIPDNTTILIDYSGDFLRLPGFLESIDVHPVIEQSYVEQRILIKTSKIEDITHASFCEKGQIATITMIRPDGCHQPLLQFSDISNFEIEPSDEEDCYVMRLQTHSYFPRILNIEVAGMENEKNHIIGSIEVMENQKWCSFEIEEYRPRLLELDLPSNTEGLIVISTGALLKNLAFVKEKSIPGNLISPITGDLVEFIGSSPCSLYVSYDNCKAVAFAFVKET